MLDKVPNGLEVGLDFMDRDHAEFVALLETILGFCETGGETAVLGIGSALDQMLQHTRDHFAREEEAMRSSGFPAYAIHRGEHERVLERMVRIVERWRAGEDCRYVDDIVNGELLPWFHQHLRTMDAATAAFILQSRALAARG